MKIILCCPFFKENLIAKLQIDEASRWVDEIHITEFDRSFQYNEKPYYFIHEHGNKVYYHKLKSDKVFLKTKNLIPHLKFFKKPYWHPPIFRNSTWYNEGMQRNYSVPDFNDEDILVLSDIDEIINSNCADRLIEEVKKRDIITVKLHFTLFYLNLFSNNWGGPADYSYRTFLIKGRTFRKLWKADSDTLRKQGERAELLNKVYCVPEFAGYHHSWLGDEKFISEKLKAYAHTEHGIYDNMEEIRLCLKEGRSIFPGHELSIKNDLHFLESIEKNKLTYNRYMI